MKALSNFSLTILLSAFVVLPICNSTGNIITSSATTAAPTYQETVLASFAGGTDGANPASKLIKGSDGYFYGTTSAGGNGYGTVFKITSSEVKTTLYNFTGGNDGAAPQAGLVLGSDGNFYGTTSKGGPSGDIGYGTVFKITPQGVKTTLYSFAGGNDGENPQAGLIQGSDGNFYGTTVNAGWSGGGTVFKITSSGVKTTLYNIRGGTDGATPTGLLIQASDGNLYGTTAFGGWNGYGTVFKITPLGVKTILYNFTGGTDGANPFAGLIQGSDGNFYGTTYYGGNNYGTVYKVTPQGIKTVLYSFAGGNDGANPYAELIQGSDGNFYGTTQYGGANNYGTVYKVTPAGVETVLWSFTGGNDGALPYAGLIQGSDGNLYGTTNNGGTANLGTVFKIYQ